MKYRGNRALAEQKHQTILEYVSELNPDDEIRITSFHLHFSKNADEKQKDVIYSGTVRNFNIAEYGTYADKEVMMANKGPKAMPQALLAWMNKKIKKYGNAYKDWPEEDAELVNHFQDFIPTMHDIYID